MRRLVLLILALATLLPSLASGYDVLVLQSRRDPGYAEVLKGFHDGVNPSERIIVLSDYAEVDVARIVREDRPKVILAVGDAALTTARKVRNTPVVAVMSLGIHNRKNSQSNLSGIGMFAPPERYISLFKTMKAGRVGVIHNPARSGWYLQLAHKAAAAEGIELVVREVSTPRETIEELSTLAGKVDALWMLPDTTAVTRETTEAYFHFGQQHSVPVVSFAANYLGLGAAAVIELDRVAMGAQADAMINSLLNGTAIDGIQLAFPKRTTSKTNPGVLKHFGLSFND
jgi:putative ABC transport system substrate-binding protein